MKTSPRAQDKQLHVYDVARWVLICLFVGGVTWAWGTGRLSALDLDGVRGLVQASGPWGPLVYVLTFGLLQPFGVSAHLFIVGAGVVWPVSVALVCSQLGLVLGTGVSYGIGRVLAPETLRRRLPDRVLAWEKRLHDGGLPAVILVRLVFFTFFPMSALMGAMRISWRNYLLGTFLGCLPVAIFEVVLAHELAVRFGGAS